MSLLTCNSSVLGADSANISIPWVIPKTFLVVSSLLSAILNNLALFGLASTHENG